jgi:hypothetical protein
LIRRFSQMGLELFFLCGPLRPLRLNLIRFGTEIGRKGPQRTGIESAAVCFFFLGGLGVLGHYCVRKSKIGRGVVVVEFPSLALFGLVYERVGSVWRAIVSSG